VDARYGNGGLHNLEDAATQARPQDRYSRGEQDLYLTYLIYEVYPPGNVLRGGEEELFATCDRLIAEYEFRISVTVPLIALIVTLATRWTPLWLLALLPLLLLLKTGSERRMKAGDVLADAVRQGRLSIVTPPTYSLTIRAIPPLERIGPSPISLKGGCTLPAMHHDTFNADFYITAATVIPLLYVTLALQGTTYQDLVRMRFDITRMGPDLATVKWFIAQAAAGLIWWAGILGEVIAFWALYTRSTSPGMKTITLVCVFVLLALAAGIPISQNITKALEAVGLTKPASNNTDSSSDS
jgi:hypothetical protein